MVTRNRSAFLLPIVFVISLCSHVAYADTAPCALLTQDQVKTAVGAAVSAGSSIYNTGCSWTATGATRLMVTVSMQSQKMFEGAKSSSAPGMTHTTVSGIGDEAIFVGVQGFSSLWVRNGSKILLVRIYGLPVSEAQTKLNALAKTAVAKL